MAEAVMGPLVGRLQELAMSEARAMMAVNDDVRSLRDKLMWMQAFLRDAEPRRRAKNDELIRVCLQQTRDAVFDAEDAVDQYFLQVDLSRPFSIVTKMPKHDAETGSNRAEFGHAPVDTETAHELAVTGFPAPSACH
ncbi:putative disease resistance protein At1g59780 [Lolium rigidum]|uniref:putative disease resistance protein At1g59780 n=1 Tax=Lolium rigidum TaxID=89674 RepID=UPI001F5DC2EF|nr:putative disease resistance protein At1g59780 [Lolium rigidum]